MYRKKVYWWESVLMLHRLTLAVIYSFMSTVPMVQTMVSTVVCVIFAMVHAFVQPLRSPTAHTLQTFLLFCLVVVALCR